MSSFLDKTTIHWCFVTGTNPVPTRILVLYFENDGNSHAITMCEVQVFSDPGIEKFLYFQ